MSRKIIKYLKTKEETDYNHLDRIFELYLSGNLSRIFSEYGFSKIELFPELHKKGNLLQVYCYYYNLVVVMQFDDTSFDYAIYLPGITAEQFERSFIQNDYTEDFDIKKFVIYLHSLLKNDKRLIVHRIGESVSKKIIKYLKTKEEKDYNHLDSIFKSYLDGNLTNILSECGFTKIELFPELHKKENFLQINCLYFNLVVFIEFSDENIDYCVSLPDMASIEIDKYFITSNYTENFKIERFIYDFHAALMKDSRLKIDREMLE